MSSSLRSTTLSMALQVVSCAVAVAAAQSVMISLGICSVIAMLLACVLRLPISWIVMNGLLPFSAAWALSTEDAVTWWLLGAVTLVLASLYLPTFWTRVPLYLSEPEVVDILAELVHENGQVTELGAGFGSVLFPLAEKRPDLTFTAYEVSPLPCLVLWLRALPYRSIRVRWQSFWRCNFDSSTVFFAFLSPEPMEEIWSKIKQEAPPSSTLFSYQFPVLSALADSRCWEVLPHKYLYAHELLENEDRQRKQQSA